MICFPSETPLEKTNCSLTSGYHLEIAFVLGFWGGGGGWAGGGGGPGAGAGAGAGGMCSLLCSALGFSLVQPHSGPVHNAPVSVSSCVRQECHLESFISLESSITSGSYTLSISSSAGGPWGLRGGIPWVHSVKDPVS